jgi:hypothetical protein
MVGSNPETMIITNPTNQTVSIGIKGSAYELQPGESRNIIDSHAEIWLRTHGFLVAEASVEVAPKIEEVKEEAIAVPEETIAEEIQEEVTEEAPRKVAKVVKTAKKK